MKRKLLLLASLLIATTIPSAAQYVSNDNEDGVYKVSKHAPRYREGEIIVKIKSTSVARVKSAGGKVSATVSSLNTVLSKLGVNEAEE